MDMVTLESQLKAAEKKGYEMGLSQSALILIEKCMTDGLNFKDSVEFIGELFGMTTEDLSSKFEEMVLSYSGKH